jgi:tetratricopeptide (TPR) repeat protein
LGRTQLLIGDHFDGQWAGPRIRGMLGALLLRPNQTVSFEELIHWVWPEDAEPPKPSTIHTYAARIRDALRQMEAPPRLLPDRGAYRIEVDREDVDIFEFLGLAGRGRLLGRQGDHAGACEALLSALDIWSDRPLADLEGEQAQNWRQASTDEYWLPTQNELMRELSALGEFGEVLRRFDGLPPEYLTNLLMVKRRLEALYGLHRNTDATAYFLRMRKRMLANHEHGEAEELTRFHNALLRRAENPTAHDGDGAATPADPAPRVPRLLPHDVPDLVGRDQLLNQLDAAVTTPSGLPMNRIVCVDGPPGIGKTALVVRWAHRVADRFPGGLLYVDLNGASDSLPVQPATVVNHFLLELDFPAERIPTVEGRASKLRNLLSGRRALVVLDNAVSTEDLLPLLNCLPCSVIVTSRRRLTGLGRRGAARLSVSPLSYRDASNWLANRVGARALNEPDEVTALARMCGGHALMQHVVTEHVVGRPRVRLAEFVEELRDTRAMLELGEDADNPGGSVQAAFTTAVQSLDVSERRLFALLGVHPGPDISVQAAAALAGQGLRSVRRLLDSLVDAHLLTQPEARERYRFHDLLRVFAATRVATEEYREERLAAEQRMLNFYQHGVHGADMKVFPYRTGSPVSPLLDDVTPPTFSDESSAISWCVQERANLSALIQFAGQRKYDSYATSLPGSVGEIFARLGYYDEVFAALTVGMESARATGDHVGIASSHNNLGFYHLNFRDLESAEACFTTARQLYAAINDEGGVATATHNLSRVHVERGEYRRGIEGLFSALATFRRLGARGAEVNTLGRLAEAHRRSHDLGGAISFAQEALWLAGNLADQSNQGFNLTELSLAHYELGETTTARGYAERALMIHIRLNSFTPAGRTSAVLAGICRHDNDLPGAEHHARSATQFCHRGRDAAGEAAASDLLAEILHAQARHEEAAEAWSKSLEIFEDIGDPKAHSIRASLADLADALHIVPLEQTRPLANHKASHKLTPHSPS